MRAQLQDLEALIPVTDLFPPPDTQRCVLEVARQWVLQPPLFPGLTVVGGVHNEPCVAGLVVDAIRKLDPPVVMVEGCTADLKVRVGLGVRQMVAWCCTQVAGSCTF